ncbi:MAG: hypothetical protein WBB45_15445 [Cyclobacteriaceae bacterium]
MTRLLLIISCLVFSLSVYAQDSEHDGPDAVAEALLKTLEGPKNAERNWEMFESYFVEGARISLLSGPKDSTVVRHMTLTEFMEAAGANYKKNGFYEYEITEPLVRIYGNTATVWQPYGIKFDPEGEEFMRGINIYHMLKVNGRWLIAFLTWQTEAEDTPLSEWREEW